MEIRIDDVFLLTSRDRDTFSWLIWILYWMSATVLTGRTVADMQKKIKIKREKSGRGRGWEGGRGHHVIRGRRRCRGTMGSGTGRCVVKNVAGDGGHCDLREGEWNDGKRQGDRTE